jgi:4-hydroxybenzoate polyprenyltransferase
MGLSHASLRFGTIVSDGDGPSSVRCLLRLESSHITHPPHSWALVYDTIYACPDRKDDKKAGVMSAAVLLGDYVKPALAGFAGIVVSALAWTGFNFRLGWPYWLITVGFTAAHFTWQVVTVDLDDPRDCWAKFQSNGSIGFMIWLGLFACYYQGQGLTV